MSPLTRKVREGPSIREFLRYYVLVLLENEALSAREIKAAIKRESEQNREFRPSGQLVVSRRDLRLVLGQLRRRDLIRPTGQGWAITTAGQNRLASYEEQKEKQTNGKERAARKLLRLMEANGRHGTVLDVGTGGGFLALRIADRGYTVLGIDSADFDWSKDSIQSAAEKAQARGGEVEFREASVAELAEQPERFDCVVTSQAIHHMKDQRGCLDAIHRLLKPGGLFLCMDFLVGLEGFLHHGWHGFLALSREEWMELLPEVGFDEPKCHKAGDYLVVLARKRSARKGEQFHSSTE